MAFGVFLCSTICCNVLGGESDVTRFFLDLMLVPKFIGVYSRRGSDVFFFFLDQVLSYLHVTYGRYSLILVISNAMSKATLTYLACEEFLMNF